MRSEVTFLSSGGTTSQVPRTDLIYALDDEMRLNADPVSLGFPLKPLKATLLTVNTHCATALWILI
jgi:hypothetical protein